MLTPLIVAILSLTLVGPSDVIVMKSGKVHVGVVLKLDRDELVLQIASGKMLLDRSDLASIHFNTTARAVGKPNPGKKESTEDTALPAKKFKERSKKNSFIEVSIIGVSIGKTRSSDLFDDNKKSKTERLQIRFRFRNLLTNDSIEFDTPGIFGSAFFRVADDAGDRVKGITLGPGIDLVGELDDGHDIHPGKTAEHVTIFNPPSSDFKHLDVTVNLEAFGREGTLSFKVTRADLGL